MPLVIIVCLLLSIIYVLIDNSKKDAKRFASIKNGIKRTNLALEESLVQQYFEYEDDVNKAVELAHKYLIKHNFVPCTQPKDYVVKRYSGFSQKDKVYVTGRVSDSDVIVMIQRAINDYNKNNPDEQISDDYVYYIYDEFIKTCSFSNLNRKLKTIKHIYPVGTLVVSVLHGHCEIVDRFIEHDYESASYTLQSIENEKLYRNVDSHWVDREINVK